MNHQNWIAYLTVTTFLGGCAIGPSSNKANELRAAFASECPTTKFPTAEGASESPAIVTAIAVSLATSLVDTGVAALKKAVNPSNATLEGRFIEQGLYVYKVDPASSDIPDPKPVVRQSPKMGCLVIAVGNFSVADDGVKGWRLPFTTERIEPNEENPTSSNYRVANALGLKGPAELALYVEATRVFSADRTAVTWKPVRVYIGDYLNDSFWAGRSRGISVELRLYKPGKQEAFFSQDIPFDSVVKPLDKGSKDLADGNRGRWSALPAPMALPANVSPLLEGRPFDPYTLEIRVVETPKPYALAQAFVAAVDTNKDAIKKEVTESIDSRAKETAELTANGATLEAISNYLAAYKTAVGDCAKDKLVEKDGKPDSAGEFTCNISHDKATVAKQKAELACKISDVASCSSLPSVPSIPI